MGFVVTLVSYTPPERADSTSYTSVAIEEAEAAAGPWTLIDTQATGPDSNPDRPATRDLTTRNATKAEGWYRVKWISGSDTSTPSQAAQNVSQLAGGVRPTVFDVAAKLRARTKIRGGVEAGTFTPESRPTDEEVEALIDDALDEVLGKVATPTAGSDYERRVRGAVSLYTAVLIELSYFPEQIGTGKSPAPTYEKLLDSRLKALIAEGETGEPQGEGTTDSPADPAWNFGAPPWGLEGALW